MLDRGAGDQRSGVGDPASRRPPGRAGSGRGDKLPYMHALHLYGTQLMRYSVQ